MCTKCARSSGFLQWITDGALCSGWRGVVQTGRNKAICVVGLRGFEPPTFGPPDGGRHHGRFPAIGGLTPAIPSPEWDDLAPRSHGCSRRFPAVRQHLASGPRPRISPGSLAKGRRPVAVWGAWSFNRRPPRPGGSGVVYRGAAGAGREHPGVGGESLGVFAEPLGEVLLEWLR